MKVFLIIFIVILSVSCKREGKLCLRKAGDPTTLSFELDPFTHLIAEDNIDYTIVPSNEHKMTIECGSNIIPTIDYSVAGDSLTVKNKSACKWYRQYDKSQVKVTLYVSELKSIDLYDGGSVVSQDTLETNTLEIQAFDSGGSFDLLVSADTMLTQLHTGPVDATIKGRCYKSYCYSAGDGFIDQRDLKAAVCFVNHSGNNDFYIWATDYAGLQILRGGNVYLKGNPPIVEGRYTGSGSLIYF